jgi:16S rRNA (adenine1518-N6/adenine1519-N6)-dimethyltransferase
VERVRAKRSLSQNFLVDPNLRRKLVEELDASPSETVLEVGPGHGELGELLVGRVARLVLVEKDDRLAEILADRWGDRGDVVLVHADALDTDLAALVSDAPAYRVISNLPYSITSPLLFRFLELAPPPVRVVVLVQREVAERIVAGPGSRTYGALSVGVGTVARARIAFPVSRRAFRPVPRVDSAAVVLDPREDAPGREARAALRDLTRILFSRRRKQVRTSLRDAPTIARTTERIEEILSIVGIEPTARPETISPERLLRLAEGLELGSGGGRESGDTRHPDSAETS